MKKLILLLTMILASIAYAEQPDECSFEETMLLEPLKITKVRWDLHMRINANDAAHYPECGTQYNHPVVSIDFQHLKREKVSYTIAHIDQNGLPYFYSGETSKYRSGRIYIPRAFAQSLYNGDTLLLEVWAGTTKTSFQQSVRVQISKN